MLGVDQEPQGLTGCLTDIVYSANGAPTPGLFAKLANNASQSIAFGHAQAVGRVQQLPNFGAFPVHSRRATCDLFILTTFLPTLQGVTSSTRLYKHPARLDTGRVANTYPGGIRTRLSINHFQSARAFLG
jgi:hypothetical protein